MNVNLLQHKTTTSNEPPNEKHSPLALKNEVVGFAHILTKHPDFSRMAINSLPNRSPKNGKAV